MSKGPHLNFLSRYIRPLITLNGKYISITVGSPRCRFQQFHSASEQIASQTEGNCAHCLYVLYELRFKITKENFLVSEELKILININTDNNQVNILHTQFYIILAACLASL